MRKFLQRMVSDRVVLLMILFNVFTLFLRGFAEEKDGAGHVFFWIEYACTVYFLLELSIKVWVSGRRAYWAVGWNRMDTFLVVASASTRWSWTTTR